MNMGASNKILITGDGGFIGKALVDKLIDHGHTVHLLTRVNDALNNSQPTEVASYSEHP